MNRERPVLMALTGSIGMGKSTVAGFFAEHGVPVWNADDAVHRLYQKGQPGFDAIAALVPDACQTDTVDRAVLSQAIRKDDQLLTRIEAAIHPLVARDREAFKAGLLAPYALFDIPLLFENGNENDFDVVVVVNTDENTQKARVMARPGMTEEKFETINSRQIPNDQKVARADYVVDTGVSIEETRSQVARVLDLIKDRFQI